MDDGRFDRLSKLVGGRMGVSRRAASKLAVGGAVGVAFGRGGLALARAATPPAGGECPTTTLEENNALVERYWAEVWTAGGEAAVADILAADELHHWGVFDDTTGHAAFTERLLRFLTAFPDIAVRVDQLVAEGDLVVSRWTETATHQGDWFGVPATGNEVEWTGMNIFRIECGRIAESWGQADHLGLLRQIGAVPPAATPAPE